MMDTQSNRVPFRAGHTLALAAIILLALGALVDACSALVHVAQVSGPANTQDLASLEGDIASPLVLVQAGLAVLNFLVYVTTIIFFLLWLYRAYSNLPALGARGLDGSPGWAVGSFFIPFLNLVRPFQAVREIWRWSKPGDSAAGIGGLSFTADTRAPLVAWWWGFWIASNVASNIYWRIGDNKEAAGATAWFGLITDLLSIVAAALAVMLIRAIDRMQIEKSTQLALNYASFEQPPPPPAFNGYAQGQQ
ncbi:MAG TPA: DUF4328 domain-containing protein [Pyrinomonadaceae bacterium]|jgi:hypothetical protein